MYKTQYTNHYLETTNIFNFNIVFTTYGKLHKLIGNYMGFFYSGEGMYEN